MNRTKLKKLRHQEKMKSHALEKEQKENAKKKEFLLLMKRKKKTDRKKRSEQFFNERVSNWNDQRSKENLAIPSIITDEWGKCTKKRSPLDDF